MKNTSMMYRGNGSRSRAASSTEASEAPQPIARPKLVTIFPWVIVAVVVTHVILLLAYTVWRTGPMNNRVWIVLDDLYIWIGEFLNIPFALFALRELRRLGIRPENTNAAFRAWGAVIFIGLSGLFDACGQAFWVWYDSTLTYPPYPSIADVLFLISQPCFLIGIALWLPRGGSVAGRTRLLVDAGTMVLSVFAISWYFVLGPTIANLKGEFLVKAMALTLPTFDLCIGVVAVLLFFNPFGSRVLTHSLTAFAAGVAARAITDSIYGYMQSAGAYYSGALVDGGWSLSRFLIIWAILIYPYELAQSMQEGPERQGTTTRIRSTVNAILRAITPLLFTLITSVLLIVGIALRDEKQISQVLLVCAGLFLLPVVRQMLTLVDNMVLNERLKVALDQSQQAYKHSQHELLHASSRAEELEELRANIAHIQQTHARLAQGDFNARANVDGPLAPVSMSLNLLIERMSNWRQEMQKVQVYEQETELLQRALDEMAEGKLSELHSTKRSSLASGRALLSLIRVQNRLDISFRRMRESINLAGRRMHGLLDTVKQARQGVQNGNTSPGQLDETLSTVERGLTMHLSQLQELWQQFNVYIREERSSGRASRPDNRETRSPH